MAKNLAKILKKDINYVVFVKMNIIPFLNFFVKTTILIVLYIALMDII